MVYISKPFVVAALIIAPAIAAPLSGAIGSSDGPNAREYEDSQLEAREPLKLRGAFKKVGRIAGGALKYGGKAASLLVREDLQSDEQYAREYEDSQFEAREPLKLRGAFKKVGRIAGGALKYGGKAASLFIREDLQPEELEAREPLKLGGLRRVARGAGKTLDRAGTVATIASILRPQPQPAAREFDETELEARGRAWDLGKKAFLAGSAGATLGNLIAPVFKRPKSPTYRRSFDDDEDLFGREFEIDELDARTLAGTARLLRFGKAFNRGAKYVVPAAGAAGFGVGVASKLRSRDLTEGFEVYEREASGALDELD